MVTSEVLYAPEFLVTSMAKWKRKSVTRN